MSESDRRQQILDAAMRVFAREGFHKANIKQIAREAGIKSPGLIYHYFEGKKDLLHSLIAELTPVGQLPFLNEETAQQVMALPPEILLPRMMAHILSAKDHPVAMSLLRIYLSEAVRTPEVMEVATLMQERALAFLEAYLERQIAIGRLRPLHVGIAARMLMGSVAVYVLGHTVFPGLGHDLPATDVYARQAVDLFLKQNRIENDE